MDLASRCGIPLSSRSSRRDLWKVTRGRGLVTFILSLVRLVRWNIKRGIRNVGGKFERELEEELANFM